VEAVRRIAPVARVVEMPRNDGYMPACNAAAALASGDLLCTLDADAVVSPGFREALVAGAERWDTWMGLLTMDGGRLINTSGGVSHFTGISWTHQVGEPVSVAGAESEPVAFATGACMTTTRAMWERLGGLPDDYFLYFDDVDYSWRTWLVGGRVGVEPAARVDHLYDFEKRSMKWRLLERNRWASIVRCYPGALLALVLPALVATELALLLVALRGGWAVDKLRAMVEFARWLPRLLRERREIQAGRVVSAGRFARILTADLSSPYLGRAGQSGALRGALRAYWAVVRALLR
jgi:GT2 family glycosyltransferase